MASAFQIHNTVMVAFLPPGLYISRMFYCYFPKVKGRFIIISKEFLGRQMGSHVLGYANYVFFVLQGKKCLPHWFSLANFQDQSVYRSLSSSENCTITRPLLQLKVLFLNIIFRGHTPCIGRQHGIKPECMRIFSGKTLACHCWGLGLIPKGGTQYFFRSLVFFLQGSD